MKIAMVSFDESNLTAGVAFTKVGMVSRKKLLDAVKFDKDVFLTDEESLCKCNKGCKNEVDLSKAQVIFQDGTTVLIVDGEKYFARPEKGEKFDAEKGLLVCLMKCAGLTTSDFLELMKNAKTGKKTVKRDKVKTIKRAR